MKKIIALLLIVLTAVCAAAFITACVTPPEPPPAPPSPPPPEPEPPPPPPPEPKTPPDLSPPQISVEIAPQPFSPISPDGEEQFLTAKIRVKSASPIYGWQIEVREPGSNRLFLSVEQEGDVPETIIWNGRNNEGELVESATPYHVSLRVTNIYHDSLVDEEGFLIPEDKTDEIAGQKVNGSTIYQGVITIDVLVQREEKGLLRIIVPSIIFAPYTGDLEKGLDPDTAASNIRILKRIAEVLGYFETYKVRVEGHANPTAAPNSKQRITEETRGLFRGDKGLQPLSEERAKAVVDYLVNLGVDPSRLTPIGMGGTRIRVDFADRDNWWKNRRVEFILEKPENNEK
ncbi:MAG: OmpA family protein [Treponema sp.]|jgi:flagellar motor protein MotB|nr:OmpA family protein [Treponema sp.]